MTMTIKMKSDLSIADQIGILQDEIAAKENLIDQRKAWLHNEYNKKKSTYTSIAADTREHQEELDEMKKQLEDLRKKVA